jgi:predicted PhzF superfamily epimerase YddE/YHI9
VRHGYVVPASRDYNKPQIRLAGLALWLIGEGLLPPRYVASQGAAVDRAGRVTVSAEADGTWIGGRAVIVLEGTAALD